MKKVVVLAAILVAGCCSARAEIVCKWVEKPNGDKYYEVENTVTWQTTTASVTMVDLFQPCDKIQGGPRAYQGKNEGNDPVQN